jgi:hypothetical protein
VDDLGAARGFDGQVVQVGVVVDQDRGDLLGLVLAGPGVAARTVSPALREETGTALPEASRTRVPAVNEFPPGAVMSLRDRVRQLREEHAWSQGELPRSSAPTQPRSAATRTAGSPPPPTPSPPRRDLRRLHRLPARRRRPRRPFRSPEDSHRDRLAAISELSNHDRELVLSFIDALVTKTASRSLPAASADQESPAGRYPSPSGGASPLLVAGNQLSRKPPSKTGSTSEFRVLRRSCPFGG